MGEQEREQLRIDAQRLREELGDLKIEAELLQDKVAKYESRHLSALSTDLSMLGSPTFDKGINASPGSTASSPLITTPPDSRSLAGADTLSELRDPPSPPMSDVSVPLPKPTKTPAARRSRLPSSDNSTTPKPRPKPITAPNRVPGSRISTGGTLRTPANRATGPRSASHKIPASNSLTHIRSLTAQMQRLEARVQSVRSKLPGPTRTPPRASPRSSIHGVSNVPATVTIRSRKRTGGSTTGSSVAGDETTPTNGYPSTASKPSHVPRLSTSGISRLSFGPLPNRGPDSEVSQISRPSSRASVSSYARPPSRTDMVPPPRPMSRSSMTGNRTPMGRPRSSLGGSFHGHSASLSHYDLEEEDESDLRTPSRRGAYSKLDGEGSVTGIPTPSTAIPAPSSRRLSGGGSRRISTGPHRASISNMRKLSDLGETY